MTDGLTRGSEPEATPDDSAATSARFRIEIDAFGRVVPRVIPTDNDDKEPAK